MPVLRSVMAFIAAALLTYVLAAAVATQFVLARLGALNVSVALSDRLRTTVHDVAGMADSYGLIVAAGLLVAFSVAAALVRFAPARRTLLYSLAGGAGVVGALLIMRAVFEVMPLAGARSLAGMTAQGLTGMAGGWVFANLLAIRGASPPTDR